MRYLRRDWQPLHAIPLAALTRADIANHAQELAQRAQALETDSLSMSIGPDLPFLVHIVAKEKGWFEEAGFKSVDFKTFASGNLAGEALLSGDIQLWTPGNLPPVSMAHNGIPVVILGFLVRLVFPVERLFILGDRLVDYFLFEFGIIGRTVLPGPVFFPER